MSNTTPSRLNRIAANRRMSIRKRKLNQNTDNDTTTSENNIDNDIVSIAEDESDSDVEIIETTDQVIVLDEDSCHTFNDGKQIDNTQEKLTKKKRKVSKTPAFSDASFIPLDSGASTPIQSINLPEYKSSLAAIKPTLGIGLRLLSPNTINQRHTAAAPQPLVELFFEDKCPSARTTPVPLYNSVFSSESAMLQQAGAGKRKNSITPTKAKHRKSTNSGNNANDSVIFVSETILPKSYQQSNSSTDAKLNSKQRRAATRLQRRLSGGIKHKSSNSKQSELKHSKQRRLMARLKSHIASSNKASGRTSNKSSTDDNSKPQTSAISETFYNSSDNNASATNLKRAVIIDGSNLAFFHSNQNGFSVKGIEICLDFFEKQGHDVRAVIPQNRLNGTRSSDPVRLQQLFKDGKIVLTPCKNLPGIHTASYDDRFIFTLAEKFDAAIISNDNYRDMATEKPEWKKIAETRVIGFSFYKDAIILPSDPYGNFGPTLYEILNRPETNTTNATTSSTINLVEPKPISSETIETTSTLSKD